MLADQELSWASAPFHHMKNALNLVVVLLIVVSFTTTGCGYRFSVEGRGPMIGTSSIPEFEGPPVIMTIPTIANRTFESNLEYKYTEFLKDEFVVTGGAKVVENIRDADYVLNGAIESVDLPSLAFSENQTQESRVTVNVKVEVKDRRSGKILWQQSSSSSAEFFVGSVSNTGGGGGIQFNRVLQDRALEQAGQFVAEDLADRFLFARERGLLTPKPTKPSPASITQPQNEGNGVPPETQPSLSPLKN